MKLKFQLRLAGICSALTAIAFAQDARPTTAPALRTSIEKTSTNAFSTPALTRTEALVIIAAGRRYVAHPSATVPNGTRAEPKVETPDFVMANPPPAPRAETKPASPEPSYVWVAGHYMPVKGEWRWVMGEWAAPATPTSVWISARYEAKESKWVPGYWQPDVAPSAPAEPPTKNGVPVAPPPY